MNRETIVASATAMVEQPIGIIRISGEQAYRIGCRLSGIDTLAVRKAHVLDIGLKQKIDKAVVIYFKAPYSFTGEDVVEIQMHGNPHLLSMVIAQAISLGAAMAQPGEFSLRAFQNGKMSLVQAESIADLIHAKSEKAALSASRSLQGRFCQEIHALQEEIMGLRVEVESVIDFDESDIPTLSLADLQDKLVQIRARLGDVIRAAKSGVRLSQSIEVVLAGKPNAGKSTLMNALCGESVAIITAQAGTTRDLISRDIVCDGLPVRITDTAGLRKSEDLVEKEGIDRAQAAIVNADLVILLEDDALPDDWPETQAPVWRVKNKIDLSPDTERKGADYYISAKTGEGLSTLKTAIAGLSGQAGDDEQPFSARQRHLQALYDTQQALEEDMDGFALDICAASLRMAHHYLGQAVGQTTPDDVLGDIFSAFCIGK